MVQKEIINILMSTYNGERYVIEQVESIMRQEGCKPILIIRDDGSTDKTLDRLSEMKHKYGDAIRIYRGKNIGYRESFMLLLKKAADASFYAYADQDDIWLPDKCKRAIENISAVDDFTQRKILYGSSVILVNDENKKLGINDISTSPNNIGSYFTRHRIAGCSMVFTKPLKDCAVGFLNQKITNKWMDHDFMIGSLAYAYGDVLRDKNSYIMHKRHESSVTGGGQGLLKRLQTEKFVIFERKNLHYDMARMLLGFDKKNMNSDVRVFLEKIVLYKDSMKYKLDLLKENMITSGIKCCDVETKLKIILNNF